MIELLANLFIKSFLSTISFGNTLLFKASYNSFLLQGYDALAEGRVPVRRAAAVLKERPALRRAAPPATRAPQHARQARRPHAASA